MSARDLADRAQPVRSSTELVRSASARALGELHAGAPRGDFGSLGSDYEARATMAHRDSISFTSDLHTIVNNLPNL